ncbi:MAG: hypothetical protein K2Y71_13015 [Xanthobacteraceae bacterium]|nr:hypothetical protein [Xanthobacteraceae bacterium]
MPRLTLAGPLWSAGRVHSHALPPVQVDLLAIVDRIPTGDADRALLALNFQAQLGGGRQLDDRDEVVALLKHIDRSGAN